MSPRFTPGLVPPDPRPERALWFVFRGRELLVHDEHGVPPMKGPESLGLTPVRWQYLGIFHGDGPPRPGAVHGPDDRHCFACELAAGHEPPKDMAFKDLRALFGRLDEPIHALAGRAVQIVDWDRSHQFCGACATPTEPSQTERSRTCPKCGLTCFPRLAPAVIVAVERGNEILLARSPHFPPGFYSTPAGFVEPGESLEECVAREIREETGIEVGEITYFASQPWPFPNSLMVGFTAKYAGGEIRVDRTELEDAKFFRSDDMPMWFKGRISISGWLIEDFLMRKQRA